MVTFSIDSSMFQEAVLHKEGRVISTLQDLIGNFQRKEKHGQPSFFSPFFFLLAAKFTSLGFIDHTTDLFKPLYVGN